MDMQSRWTGVYPGGNSVVHVAAHITGYGGEYEYDAILSEPAFCLPLSLY